jgi:hypothetical protein
MIDNIKNLLEENMLRIMENVPSACMIFIDPVGQWDVRDFEILWFNKAAKELFGSRISGGKLHPQTDQRLRTYTENLRRFRQRMVEGQESFIGPFSATFINDSGKTILYDRYTMYLGEIGFSRPTFLFLAQGKAIE